MTRSNLGPCKHREKSCSAAALSSPPAFDGAASRARPIQPLPAGAALACGAILALLAGGCASKCVIIDTHGMKDFQRVVLDSDKPVLVDFWKFGCASCAMLDPIMEKLAEEYQGRGVVISKFMIMHFWLAPTNWEVLNRYDFAFFPTVILFINGKPTKRWVWNVDTNVYRKALDELVEPPATQKETVAARAKEPAGGKAKEPAGGKVGFVVEAEKFKLINAKVKDYPNASHGKAVLFDKATSKIEAAVNLPAGKFDVVLTGMAPDANCNAVIVTLAGADPKAGVKGNGGRVFFDKEFNKFGRGSARLELLLPTKAAVTVTIAADHEKDMAIDKVEFIPAE